jgi:hypothetical protein
LFSLDPIANIRNIYNLDISSRELLGGIDDLSPLASLNNLEVLNASDNQGVKDFSPLARLPRMRILVVSNCRIANVSSLANLKELSDLDLSGNIINDWTPVTMITNLRVLILSNNVISEFPPLFSMSNLRVLDLSYNNLTFLPDFCFEGLVQLQSLYLSGNILMNRISPYVLKGSLPWWPVSRLAQDSVTMEGRYGPYRLQHLALFNCSMNELTDGVFDDVWNLSSLDLRYNKLESINPDVFYYLSLDTLKTDDFSLCCAAENHAAFCSPPGDEFSSCSDLMARKELKVAIWVLGFMSVVCNLLVIVLRSTGKKANEVQKILVINLSLSDFIMGIYLLIIGAADVYFRGEYYVHESKWRGSPISHFYHL